MSKSSRIAEAISKELDARKKGALAGLSAGAKLVERRAKQLVPVEYGNLRASGYSGRDPDNNLGFVVGFTASYAAAVHERVEMKWAGKPRRSGIGKYWGPAGEAKFLEKSFNESKSDIRSLVASHMRNK